jgi:hypothetical protein
MKKLLVLLSLFFAACQPQTETITLPLIPKWQTTENAKIWGNEEIRAYLQEIAPGVPVRMDDSKFVLVSYEHFVAMLNWGLQFKSAANISYVGNSHDCDKFAKALVYAFGLSAAYSNIDAMPMVAVLIVIQEKSWGNVPAGGYHAVVGIATNKGIFVIEPQSGFYAPLSKYPNPVLEIRVGA